MESRAFLWVDAFADAPLRGNPCAVVFDADGLDDAAMLAIAREMNLSETAFVLKPRAGDARARYFTPEREIPLAGHPTIATVHALLESGRLAPPPAGPGGGLRLELPAATVTVEVEGEGRSRWIGMLQPAPRFLRSYPPEHVLPLFGLDASDALPGVPVQTVSTGTPMLMVPVRDREALRRVELRAPAFRRLRDEGDFFSPHLFCLEGETPEGRTFARHLGLPPDTLEDPFTGSATGCMGAFLWRYGLIEDARFVAEQGHWLGRPGQARVEVQGSRDASTGVKVWGQAVTVLRGTIEL